MLVKAKQWNLEAVGETHARHKVLIENRKYKVKTERVDCALSLLAVIPSL